MKNFLTVVGCLILLNSCVTADYPPDWGYDYIVRSLRTELYRDSTYEAGWAYLDSLIVRYASIGAVGITTLDADSIHTGALTTDSSAVVTLLTNLISIGAGTSTDEDIVISVDDGGAPLDIIIYDEGTSTLDFPTPVKVASMDVTGNLDVGGVADVVSGITTAAYVNADSVDSDHGNIGVLDSDSINTNYLVVDSLAFMGFTAGIDTVYHSISSAFDDFARHYGVMLVSGLPTTVNTVRASLRRMSGQTDQNVTCEIRDVDSYLIASSDDTIFVDWNTFQDTIWTFNSPVNITNDSTVVWFMSEDDLSWIEWEYGTTSDPGTGFETSSNEKLSGGMDGYFFNEIHFPNVTLSGLISGPSAFTFFSDSLGKLSLIDFYAVSAEIDSIEADHRTGVNIDLSGWFNSDSVDSDHGNIGVLDSDSIEARVISVDTLISDSTSILLGSLILSFEELTCVANLGVVSLDEICTFVITDGGADDNMDTVTVADGIRGQLKIIDYLTDTDTGDSVYVETANGDDLVLAFEHQNGTFLFDGVVWIITSHMGDGIP